MSGSACEEVVQDLLAVAQLGLADWCVEEAFFNCVLWALTEIFKAAAGLGKRQKEVQSLASRLQINLNPLRKAERCNEDQAKVLELAARLMSWPPKKSLTPSH
eukprot:gnl/TRDRNA2_/TRDRNA2_171236_c0_seq2.p1 gnl/TRDRNA2_/TRDRNA2_171236_c0~~gnl/TRDRNA2_/TRDRNA2_171236_c0_seq2.p1  ORF type:complete len:103 (-),score=22.18 gnl/TRDRNA2_/TRDRNA2_171236_c0_seq2:311-619(-)